MGSTCVACCCCFVGVQIFVETVHEIEVRTLDRTSPAQPS